MSMISIIVGYFKTVFHFNSIVPKRSVFLCFLNTRVELMTWTQRKMLRYDTIEMKNRLVVGYKLHLESS